MSQLANRPVHAMQNAPGRVPGSPGMNLRQHYAGLAMQALASAATNANGMLWTSQPAQLAVTAVEIADALIAELEK